MPYLAFNLNDGNEFIFDLLEERLSLGRNPSNEIVIDNNQISSFHAEFARQPGGAYLLTDLKSSNGTYVNGRRVESAELKSGDRVRFGQLEARFRAMSIPGPGREKKGPTPSAEEKRRAAESSGGPNSRTDIIPLAFKPEEADAARVGTANDQPIAPATRTGAAGNSTPKPAPAASQIVAEPKPLPPQHRPGDAAPSVAPATEALHKQHAALQAELVKLEAQIKASGEESTRQRKLFESEKRELEEALVIRREQLKAVEHGVTEFETRRAAAERRMKEVAEAEGRLISTTEVLQRVVEQRSAAEIALAALKAAHEQEQKKFNDTTAGHAGVRRQDEEAKLELSRLYDELADLRNEISRDESKRAELAGLIAKLATECGVHEAELTTLSAERERRETGLEELAAREQELRTSAGTLQDEMEAARKRFEELRNLSGEAELNLSARQIELGHAVAEKESSLRSLEERIALLVRREEEFTIKLQALPATDSRLKDATKALSLVEEQKDALERDVASLTRQREEKEREIAGLAEQGAAQHTLLQTLSNQTAWLEESVKIRQRRVEAANRYLAGIDSRAAELEAESAAHQAELENARARLTRAAAVLESLHNEIQAATTAKEKLLAKHDERACFS